MSNDNKIIKPYIKQFYKKNKLNFTFALIEVIAVAAIMIGISWILQQVTDLVAGSNNTFTLLQIVIISGGALLAFLIVYLIAYKFKPLFITKGISQYKEYVFESITKKNISAFTGEESSKYISALTNDIQTIQTGYLDDTFTIILNVITFMGALALMLYYSPLLTLIAIGLAVVPVIASMIFGGKMAKAEKLVSDQNEVYTATLKDTLSGFSVIKSFKVEAQMLKNFKENVRRLANCQNKKLRMKILMELVSSLSAVVVQIGIFIIAAYFVLNNMGVTAGVTIVFVQLLNYVLSPIQVLPQSFAERKAAKKLLVKIATELEQNIREEKESNVSLNKGIYIQNLSFGYEEGKEILHSVNCNFELGKKYAIVGTSGSGKSTLLNLLMASYNSYSGSIHYDNTEIKDINSDNLYAIESIIQQNVFIFNTTIKDNITMFQSFSDEAISNAIEMSGLKELVEEKGLDYICGENGSGLSGGEKQRVSIARSLLRKSQVLLVDEATAALDKETAYQVSNSILNLDGVTSIVVTHSLEEALLKQYDEILTFKNGSIVESGTFDSLIKNKGYFYSLFTVSQ